MKKMKKLTALPFLLFFSLYAGKSWSCSTFSYYVPDTPCDIAITMGQHNDSWGISWNTSSNASRYELYERALNGSWGKIYSGNSTNKWVYGKTQEGTYQYKVKACGYWGCSINYSPVSHVRFDNPQPSTLTLPLVSSGDYRVSWAKKSYAYVGQWYLQERFNSPYAPGWSNKVSAYNNTSKSYHKEASSSYSKSYSYRLRRCWSFYSYHGCQTEAARSIQIIKNDINLTVDIDGNGQINESDAELLSRYTRGVRGSALIAGFTGLDATTIESNIHPLINATPTIVNYQYDALGRLTKVHYQWNNSSQEFEYDPAGNRKTVTTSEEEP